MFFGPYTEAPFFTDGTSGIPNRGMGWVNGTRGGANLKIDLSLRLPTGPESSVRTLSVQYWRRVA